MARPGHQRGGRSDSCHRDRRDDVDVRAGARHPAAPVAGACAGSAHPLVEGPAVGRLRASSIRRSRNRCRGAREPAARGGRGASTRTVPAAALFVEDGNASYVRSAFVTGRFFEVLGVEPVLGRALRAEDDVDGAEPVTVISRGLWQRRYGASPLVLGRRVQIAAADVHHRRRHARPGPSTRCRAVAHDPLDVYDRTVWRRRAPRDRPRREAQARRHARTGEKRARDVDRRARAFGAAGEYSRVRARRASARDRDRRRRAAARSSR